MNWKLWTAGAAAIGALIWWLNLTHGNEIKAKEAVISSQAAQIESDKAFSLEQQKALSQLEADKAALQKSLDSARLTESAVRKAATQSSAIMSAVQKLQRQVSEGAKNDPGSDNLVQSHSVDWLRDQGAGAHGGYNPTGDRE